MSHELRNLANLPHEALTRILIGGTVSVVAVLGGIGYLVWRERKRKAARKVTRKRSHKSSGRWRR